MFIRRALRISVIVTNSRRSLCLSQTRRFKCLDSDLREIIDRRNIGIIAHIDAGKTTTTEQMLYLSGLTNSVGDVDHGNTITDFMDLERERGITIQSAAVTCIWRKHRVNIIDTPGHVDFTLEVERALRVMDGTVAVLDGATGVQAQTLTVWRQARKFNLPTVFFVNKMDKPLANFAMCVNSVENRLGRSVVPVVVPVVTDGKFVGLVDLLNKTTLNISAGNSAEWTSINKATREYEVCEEHWENLVSSLADADEAFGNRLLSNEPITSTETISVLRTLTLKNELSPIACGTALRCTRTVCPVLDMIVDYLPGPNQHQNQVQSDDAHACALVFKISHDERHGRFDYARVYRGIIREGSKLLNANRGTLEVGIKLFTPYSDVFHPVQRAEAGDVVVMTGLKSTVTGDTLVKDVNAASVTELELKRHILEGIESPDPVFSCSIEPPNASATHKFEKALAELCIEDPSLRVYRDDETGQTILQGMGELHIEIIKERLKREYDLNVFVGKLRVGYREILNESIEHSTFKEGCFSEKKQTQWCSIQLRLDPIPSMAKFRKIAINIEEKDVRNALRDEWVTYIDEGCRMALYNGPLLGFPIYNLTITLKNFITSGRRVNSALINAAAGSCVKEALQLAGTSLIEPIMKLEITLLPSGVNLLPSQHARNAVLHELANRRADITSIDEMNSGYLTLIHATIPLSETTGIARKMREITSGLCSLHMELADYQRVLPEAQEAILENYTRNAYL